MDANYTTAWRHLLVMAAVPAFFAVKAVFSRENTYDIRPSSFCTLDKNLGYGINFKLPDLFLEFLIKYSLDIEVGIGKSGCRRIVN